MNSLFPDFMHDRRRELSSQPVKLDGASFRSYLGSLAVYEPIDHLTFHISIEDVSFTDEVSNDDCRFGMHDAGSATVTVYPQCQRNRSHSVAEIDLPSGEELPSLKILPDHAVLEGFHTDHVYCYPFETKQGAVKAAFDTR